MDPHQERDEEVHANVDIDRHADATVLLDDREVYVVFPPDDYGDIGKDAYRKLQRRGAK